MFGGALEQELLLQTERDAGGYALIAGTATDLRCLFALLSLCDVLVTGDTLALHAATGLGIPVVALFGPTSAAEIGLEERGIKLVPDLDCVCCYRTQCDRRPSCMDLILPERVLGAVTEIIMSGVAAPVHA